MRKSLIGLTSAFALAASAASAPTPAAAYPGWVIPAIAVAGVGGVALGAGITSAQAQTTGSIVAPPGAVQPQTHLSYDPNTMVQPGCHLARERVRGEWRRVEVCP
jgi:hypothetical protein